MIPRFHFHVQLLREMYDSAVTVGHDFQVYYPASLKAPRDNSILFAKEAPKDCLQGLHCLRNCVIFVPSACQEAFAPLTSENVVIPVATPRLEFARLLTVALSTNPDNRPYRTLANGAVVGQNVALGEGVILEPLAFVDHDVTIGDRSVIQTGAKVRRFVSIGADTIVRECAVVGGPGFGFERTEDGTPVRLPHVGGVRIGSRVEIGALTTVVSGTIDPTIVEDDAKIDDHVHIAHNCIVRKGALITACAEVSGSVEIGEYSWLGPNCSILQGLSVGARSVVGLGAVVIKSVEPGTTVAGSPAEPTPSIKSFNVAKARLLRAVEEGRI